jgi:hypothetical protein
VPRLRSTNVHGLLVLSLVALLLVGIVGCGEQPAVNGASSDASNGRERLKSSRAELQRLKRRLRAARAQAAQSARTGSGSAPAPGAPAAGDGSSTVLSRADAQSFAQLAAQLPGEEGLALSGVGRGERAYTLGGLGGGSAWSTSKTPLAMAVITGGLAESEQANLAAAITASDNAAAEGLWSSLGGGVRAAQAADAQLRAAGDSRTLIQSQRLLAGYTPFGQTDWSLAAQVAFTAGMACTDAGRQVLSLMGQVVPSQRWGLGRLAGAQIKGGWGPGIRPGQLDGWMERQMGVVELDGRPVAVTIASSAGSHDAGIASLNAMTDWLTHHVHGSALPPQPRC